MYILRKRCSWNSNWIYCKGILTCYCWVFIKTAVLVTLSTNLKCKAHKQWQVFIPIQSATFMCHTVCPRQKETMHVYYLLPTWQGSSHVYDMSKPLSNPEDKNMHSQVDCKWRWGFVNRLYPLGQLPQGTWLLLYNCPVCIVVHLLGQVPYRMLPF